MVTSDSVSLSLSRSQGNQRICWKSRCFCSWCAIDLRRAQFHWLNLYAELHISKYLDSSGGSFLTIDRSQQVRQLCFIKNHRTASTAWLPCSARFNQSFPLSSSQLVNQYVTHFWRKSEHNITQHNATSSKKSKKGSKESDSRAGNPTRSHVSRTGVLLAQPGLISMVVAALPDQELGWDIVRYSEFRLWSRLWSPCTSSKFEDARCCNIQKHSETGNPSVQHRST